MWMTFDPLPNSHRLRFILLENTCFEHPDPKDRTSVTGSLNLIFYLTSPSTRGPMAEGGQAQPDVQHEDPMTAALAFLEPCLDRFGFRPSHSIPYLREALPELNRDLLRKITLLEKQKDMKEATHLYIDWLMDTSFQHPHAITTFLDVLRSHTEDQKHVHNMLCVSSVYLPTQLSLVNALAQRLQDSSIQVDSLLPLLQEFILLDRERATDISNMAQGCNSTEEWTNLVKVLMACLYSKQAKVLVEILGTATPSENQQDEQEPLYMPCPSNTASRSQATPGIRQTREIINEYKTGTPEDGRSIRSIINKRESAGRQVVNRLSRAGETALYERSDHTWPEVLRKALTSATAGQDTSHWSLSKCQAQQLRTLWKTASELIRHGVSRDREDQDQRNHDDTGESEGESSDSSAETVTQAPMSTTLAKLQGDAAQMNTRMDKLDVHSGKQALLQEYLLSQTQCSNITRDADCGDDAVSDVTSSFASIEANSKVREREMVWATGVLREEEARQLKASPIQLRPYQDELLTDARKGHNVLIWLPTGTGKTYIVLKYAEEHLKEKAGRHVAFVVPKVRLARQQYERFLAYLPEFKPYLKCGETSGSQSSKQSLSDVLQTSGVVVLTGQCLVEAVDNGKVSLDQFSLLVLDECHHTRGGHPLRALMNQYMELKYLNNTTTVSTKKLPQVMGLTASPGVGKARGKDLEEATKYLKQLCARLNVTHICSVRQHVNDLHRYVHEPLADVRECEKRKVDTLKEEIGRLMEEIEVSMLNNNHVEKYCDKLSKEQDSRLPQGQPQEQQTASPSVQQQDSTLPEDQQQTQPTVLLLADLVDIKLSDDQLLKRLTAPSTQRGEEQYTQWLSTVEKTLQQVHHTKTFCTLTAHIDMLKLCQRCLILNEDCDSVGALELLKEEVKTVRRDKPSTMTVDQQLFCLVDRYITPSLQAACASKACQNPKLKCLEEILLNASRDNEKHREAVPTQDPPSLPEQRPDLPHSPGDETERKMLAPIIPDLPVEAGITGGEEEMAARRDNDEESDVTSSSDTLEWSDSASVIDTDPNVRAMIFVKTLDLSKALMGWITRHPKLRWLKPGRITGVNTNVKNGGMTKSEVTEVMAKFNAGVHKVVICTSAAEEGLDFKACNLVVRYLYEASMVSMIQIRGRARDKNSQYSVMGRENSDCTAKEKANEESEKVMRQAVQSMQSQMDQDPNAVIAVIYKMQAEAWRNRWRKDVQEANRLRHQLPEGVYRLQCRKCMTPACTSNEIRLMKRTNRVVIGAQFTTRFERKDHDPSEGKVYDPTIPRTGTMHCKECGNYWGIIVRSEDDGVEFPVIPIKSFMIEHPFPPGKITFGEKWSQAFKVPELSDEDRLQHSDPLLGPSDPLEGHIEPEEDGERDKPQMPNDLSTNTMPEVQPEEDADSNPSTIVMPEIQFEAEAASHQFTNIIA